jgi:hypothetical protein
MHAGTLLISCSATLASFGATPVRPSTLAPSFRGHGIAVHDSECAQCVADAHRLGRLTYVRSESTVRHVESISWELVGISRPSWRGLVFAAVEGCPD